MLFRRCCTFMLLFCLAGPSRAHGLDGLWRLRVTNLQHRVMVEATVKFADAPARSCMGGAWKQLLIQEKTLVNDAFFPMDEQLSYQVDGPILTMGRTTVCDGYLFLAGPVGGTIRGRYDAVGWGRKPLGYFSMERVQP